VGSGHEHQAVLSLAAGVRVLHHSPFCKGLIGNFLVRFRRRVRRLVQHVRVGAIGRPRSRRRREPRTPDPAGLPSARATAGPFGAAAPATRRRRPRRDFADPHALACLDHVC
jgi:hypothetical protein